MKLIRFSSGVNDYIFAQIPNNARNFEVDVSDKYNSTTVSYFNPSIVMESFNGKYMIFADKSSINQHHIEEIIPNNNGNFTDYSGGEGDTVDNPKLAMSLLLNYLNLSNNIWILKRAF